VKRREFIAGLGSAAAWPMAAHAQQRLPMIGYLSSRARADDSEFVEAFRAGLKQTGYVEGTNVVVEYRWADDDNSRLAALTADLVGRKVAVIVAEGIPASRAAKAATTAIPIVFFTGADPVALGLVISLSRPAGNLTGVSTLSDETGPKRLEMMHELLPGAKVFTLIVDPTNPNSEKQSVDMRAAARILGLDLHILHASNEGDLDLAFANAKRLRAEALVVGPNLFMASNGQNTRLAALATQHAIPTISFTHKFAAAGGLMSYAVGDLVESYRLVGLYVGRILQGEKPGDLPVQQGSKIELVINLKTARAQGITFPLTLLGRADEVIE
jgi:putative tryptophan/tyrosine transport system substrate-binding protein